MNEDRAFLQENTTPLYDFVAKALALILFGALTPLFAAYLSKILSRLCCGILHELAKSFWRCVHFFYEACLFFKNLVLVHLVPYVWKACSWKTYKKVMPWRAATPNPSSHRAIGPERMTSAEIYGTEEDIHFFERSVTGEGGGREWRTVCERSLGDYLKYNAQMRILHGNKTEYKSICIVRDSTAEEMTEFYLDDHGRCQWDSLLAKTESIEMGPRSHRCEVVRWIRSFPFPFLSDREYVISRRVFKRHGIIYTVSKGVEHDFVPIKPSVVRMDVFYSMWSCKTVPCPWGSEKPACEVVLLHHEQFKIPEKLARFAAVRGMWGFVKSMGPAMQSFVASYRKSKALQEALKNKSSSTVNRISVLSGEDESMDSSNRQGKPKFMKTLKRALVATAVGGAVLLIRRLNKNQTS